MEGPLPQFFKVGETEYELTPTVLSQGCQKAMAAYLRESQLASIKASIQVMEQNPEFLGDELAEKRKELIKKLMETSSRKYGIEDFVDAFATDPEILKCVLYKCCKPQFASLDEASKVLDAYPNVFEMAQRAVRGSGMAEIKNYVLLLESALETQQEKQPSDGLLPLKLDDTSSESTDSTEKPSTKLASGSISSFLAGMSEQQRQALSAH